MSRLLLSTLLLIACVGFLALAQPGTRAPRSMSAHDGACVCVKPLSLASGMYPQGGPLGDSAPPSVRVLATLEELRQRVGPQVAEHLANQVDLDTQSVVVMTYETAGPPFGKPAHRIVFYIDEPVINPGEARGMALKLGQDFFAVPKGVPVQAASPTAGTPAGQ